MRRFVIFMAVLSLVATAMAQDLLVKRNGEQMRVKVLKITKKNVEFVRQGTELPIYKLPISDIEYIEYPMGDRDTFGRAVTTPTVPTPTVPTPTEPKRWHGAITPPAERVNINIEPATTNNEENDLYAVGDIYDKDGVKGVVATIYDNGAHGLVMSLEEACLPWSTLHRKKLKATGANNQNDGEANMRAIEKYIADNNLSWNDFPAFKWCRERGEGWFLPSLNELWRAGTMYMGGSRTTPNRKSRKAYNQNIELAGGQPLSNIMIYHSSTEDKDARYSLYTHMSSEQPYTNSGYKADELFVRAFRRF